MNRPLTVEHKNARLKRSQNFQKTGFGIWSDDADSNDDNDDDNDDKNCLAGLAQSRLGRNSNGSEPVTSYLRTWFEMDEIRREGG